MKITTAGIDLAKNVFQVHGVNERGKVALRKQLKRAQVLPFFANLPPCLIGMEACASAHYWARKLSALGHTVKLMAPQYVKPYVKTNKHDVADAEAICEAVGRPNMRFVAIKTAEQQAILAVHRARQGLVKARTAQANQIRGLLGEFGCVLPQGMGHIAKRLPEILEDGDNELPGSFRQLLARLGENLEQLQQQVAELEREIQRWHQDSAVSQRVAAIPGIGPLSASALVDPGLRRDDPSIDRRYVAQSRKPQEAQALLRSTALSQPAVRAAARSRGIVGSKRRPTCQLAATSPVSRQ
jgi:transposase